VDEDVFSETPFAANQADVQSGLALLQAWSAKAKTDLPGDGIEALKSDYTVLFIGLGSPLAPPWESVYRDEEHLLFQEETLQVRGWYRRFGLVAEKLGNEPDDHIGLELGFISHLAALAVAAIDKANPEEAQQMLAAQASFLKEHVFHWAWLWCQDVIEHGSSDLYRGAALVLRGALAETAKRVGASMVGRKK
jgi:putative dimethyl sulfoxide reductase chaperone